MPDPGIRMTRLPPITLLVLKSSGPAYAEWGVVSTNEEAGMTIYMDPDTYRRKENLVEVGSCTISKPHKHSGPTRSCLSSRKPNTTGGKSV